MDKWNVGYYISASGENPVSDFLDTLNEETQTKILRILGHIEEYGLQSVLPHLKKLSGTPFWEIRILGQTNVRIIYVVPAQFTVLVLHGFVKKSQKTPSKELRVAKNRYQQFVNHK